MVRGSSDGRGRGTNEGDKMELMARVNKLSPTTPTSPSSRTGTSYASKTCMTD
jgi:hypothetical protein